MTHLSSQFRREDKIKSKTNPSIDYYLQRIGETPLLIPEEEIKLAGKIRKGDREALEKLIKANLRFVVSVAKKYQNQGLPIGDLINEGNLGLINAAKRFDETRGFKFISYAVWWIRQAILQALAEQSRVVRLPLNRIGYLSKISKASSDLVQEFEREPSAYEIAEETKMTPSDVSDTLQISGKHLSLDAPSKQGDGNNKLLDVIQDDQEPSPDDFLLDEALRIEIRRALTTLSVREAEIIKLYFGLGEERPLTLEEIGERYGMSRERIRQIKKKAILRLRHVSRRRKLQSYLN